MASNIHRDTTSGVNTSAVVVTSGSQTMSSKIVAGDFLVAKVYMSCAAGVLGGFPVAPAGWSSPASNSANNGANTQGVIVFTRTATGGDAGASFTVDFTGLNVYQWGIIIDVAYATDGVTPTIDGSLVFTASAGSVSSLNLGVPILSQGGDLLYCSCAAGTLPADGNSGIAFAGSPWTGTVATIGYTSYSGGGHVGGIGGGANQIGLEGCYFGWHTTANLPTPGFFSGVSAPVIGVVYAIKAANPGAVFMGIWPGRFAGFGVPQSTFATIGYMPGSPTNIAGIVLFAAIAQCNNVGSPVGQTVAADPSWRAVAHIVDVTGTFSIDVFSHVVVGGDPSSWTFSVAVSTVLWAAIVTVGLLDTITPADVVATISQPSVIGGVLGVGGIVAPSITPRTPDELLLWFFGQRGHTGFGGSVVALSNGPSLVWRQPLGNGGNGIAAMAYGSVDNCGTQFCYDSNGDFNDAGAGVTLALKAANPPVQPAANLRVDQMALIALGIQGSPAPPPQCDAIS